MNQKNNKQIVKSSNIAYNKAVEDHGISNHAVFWDDQQTQYYRFYELVKNLDLKSKNKTILDIGCGNAELFKFLNFLGFRGKYVGYDINRKLINQARQRFSQINVKLCDINEIKSFKQFNYVVMSGLFNLKIGQDFNWVKKILINMYKHSKEIMIFNAVSTYVNYMEDKMYYLDPTEVLDFCIRNLSQRVILEHHNLPFNYTVSVFNDNEWSSINS